jgi:hypothetical protein
MALRHRQVFFIAPESARVADTTERSKSCVALQIDAPPSARNASRCDLRGRWKQEGLLGENRDGAVLSELWKPAKSV